MKRIIGGILICGVVALPAAATAVPKNTLRPSMELIPGERVLTPSAPKAATDTFWFGGTHWDVADARWEANVSTSRTNRWTFDSGVDGNLEGWWGFDATEIPHPTVPPGDPDDSFFRWTHDWLYQQYGTPGTDLFPDTAPPDTGGIWVGKYELEAQDLCFVAGQGYGNGWTLEARKAYTYGGTGDARLTYRYWQHSEKAFDFTYLYLEFDGVREAAPRVTQTFTLGSPASKRTKTLTVAASSIPAGTAEIAAVLRFVSDSGWSDEDGVGFTTPYGAFCCYNFKYEDLGTPANNDEDTFEQDPEGWSFWMEPGVGDFTSVHALSSLPPMLSPCPCHTVLQGNVLTQFDDAGPPMHPDGQDAFAMSPFIDLDEAGLGDTPVKFVVADAYMHLPLQQAVYFKVRLRQYPVLCEATGEYIEAFVGPDGFLAYVQNPTCYDDVIFEDFRTTSPDIDYCYIGLEILSLCSVSTNCTGPPGGNETPYWDNVALVVTGTMAAPAVVATDPRPFLQDIFAADGSLRPRSTCILDNSGDANFGTTASDADLEDTMYVTAAHISNNGGVQVNLHFSYRKGPGTNPGNAFFARYPLENTWYEARCDSGRMGPVITEVSGTWCSEYHESSPYFAGENAEANEILPDRLFTPGSRIEYYWSANYVNTPATRTAWPDVPAGEEPLSVDLLPGMRVNVPGDTIWPCHLYINGESRQPLAAASPYHKILPALHSIFWGDSRYPDRYDDVLTGSNTNASFARQITGENGVTEMQLFGYRSIIGVFGAAETYVITEDDANCLAFWLTTSAGVGNDLQQLLYLSGDGLAVDMSSIAPPKPNATALLNNRFGAILRCSPYRDENCPTGAAADTTFCVQLSAANGAEPGFAFTGAPYRAYGNGCPVQRRSSVLDVHAGVATAKPNLDYVDQDGGKGVTHYAAVTNRTARADGYFSTMFEGVSLSRFRRPGAESWSCAPDSLAIADRVRDVYGWAFGPYVPNCQYNTGVDPDDELNGVPTAPALSLAPNPFNPLVKLSYAVAAPGRVTIRIFDVRGALVATVVDEAKTPGRYEAVWRGTNDAGRRAASGVFWARYAIGGTEITKQLVLLK